MLPLSRVVIISDSNNWISVNYHAIVKKLFFSRFIVRRILFSSKEKNKNFIIDNNFTDVVYKGVNLYEVSKYNICVSLEIFPLEISCDREDHRSVISEWFSASAECIDFFIDLIEKQKPDRFLVWQGYSFDAAVVRNLSVLHNFHVVAVENTFDKRKIVWDDLSGIAVNRNLAKNFYWKYRDFVSIAVAEHYISTYFENIKRIKAEEHQTSLLPLAKSDKKTVLFIGQVYTDASILFGINNFSCPVEIIELLVNYCLANNYHLIIKLHPKETTGIDIFGRPYDNLTYRKISQKNGLLESISSGGFILDQQDYDTYSLIDIADVCVTVNSQAGLEALVRGRNLIVCGQSYYSGLGFTYEAPNSKSLISALDQVLKQNDTILEPDEINKFFYIVSEKYFMDRSDKSIEQLLCRSL